MKKKTIIILSIMLIAIIGITILYFRGNIEYEYVNNEIEPEEEISDDQLRQTMISVYYVDKNSNEIMPEVKIIDAKNLLNNPYEVLINYLLEGPKSENLKKAIPDGVKLNSVNLKSGVLYVDFSKEFIENHPGGEIEESNTIYTIVNTVTELTEVEAVKILIDGEENKCFVDEKMNFSESFVRLKWKLFVFIKFFT